MTNPCCCVGPVDTCTLALQVQNVIVALPRSTYTANFTGSAIMRSETQPAEWEYNVCSPDPNTGLSFCWDCDCCFQCNTPLPYPLFCTLNATCCDGQTKTQRFCSNELSGTTSARLIHNTDSHTECDCVGPAPPCDPVCAGFTGCSFTNNGLDSAIPVSCFSVPVGAPSCNYFPPNTFELGSKTVVTTVGTTTTETRKNLKLIASQTTVAGVTTCHLTLRLNFCVRSNTPWSGSCLPAGALDGFSQSVIYASVWNGTDTAAQFLNRPLKLLGVNWNYALCPAGFVGSDPWHCVTYENFVDTVCGNVDPPNCDTCTPASLDYTTTLFTPTFLAVASSCAVPLTDGLIDPIYQPWQTVPTQITIV